MSWHILPTELHIAVIHLLPHNAVRALSSASSAVRAISLPAIFANVTLPSAASLDAFVRHVPTEYGPYVRSLAICTKQPGATGASTTDALLALLHACTRLHSLSLSLAFSLDPEKAVPAFSRLNHLHAFEISCWGTEDVSPVSERLVVALAASLPALTHLSMSRITRSAIHVDPCDVPFNVPIVTNDFDVPLHPTLGSDLALPSLLRLPSLRTLEIRDTWLGCDTKIPASSSLDKLILTGSMYAADTNFEAHACMTWLRACHSLRSLELGTALASLDEHPSSLPRVSHVHINASRILPDDLSSTLAALHPCSVESISIAYEQERHTTSDQAPVKPLLQDDFARECALDDLQDWTSAIEAFLLGRSTQEWGALSHVQVSFAPDVHASWDL
ncbi:hypothetical protein JVT61DRAFT_10165 [Boletus reticuloceps]|uniref:F-box domain-containing protein n=1 Tax=Boletus reticuloceps TaxID=495285 RepID=A0A8I2YW99_9AGAM|nr:hypothetical protein JVT61DRAFT_10165 [Boletus reticuloceps]